ncbi:gamma-glutamyltransferase family protein [Microbacterium sp. C7(2022)]|uniref:gamma-glutamyltransferase family protein n=1 Tax=Microbacterium sp. C7(2022) TaxID=2992759 RepID=UPI00237A5725|nr:gamma-glutamyltransferase [Microbacterium sp. C7(2022)]MDE0545698.1 gamma-glutamyltransferase family protein [Microbacterium sp. C7(2022)]
MAASTHWLATAVAQGTLERGGNAFDAAAAGAFVLHLAEPHLNGPGGDLVGIFATADAPCEPRVLMGQGPAPAGATIDHFVNEGLDMVPGAGGLAAAVPGAVDAWLMLVRDHGTMELGDVLAPAITYAREGIPLLPTTVATISQVADLFREHWPSSADLWMPSGAVPSGGDLYRNPAYANVLSMLVDVGSASDSREARIDAAREEWATGLVARATERFLSRPHRHSSGTDHAAVITAADFAQFRASYEPAVTASFRGHVVAKGGAWCQGPALLEALRILDPLPDEHLDPSTEVGAHTIIETLKLVLADRDAHFGEGMDAARVLTDEFIAQRRTQLEATASQEWRPGILDGQRGFTPPLIARPPSTGAGTGEPTVSRTGDTRGDTCHIDVVDRWGNIVAVTPSGGWLQSSPTIPELGFCLGTRLQMTWLDPQAPSALRPGARPRTTLTPTLVLRDGYATIALGTPGGDQQDQWQLPMLLRMLVGGWSAQEAIDAPTLHTIAMVESFWPRSWDASGVIVEDRLGSAVIEGLRRRGHVVTTAGDWRLGRLSAVGIDRARGTLWAAANPRGMQGYAAGR